jgi:hypothetical protein
MYVCMHACMYVCMYVYMYACMHVYMYVHIQMGGQALDPSGNGSTVNLEDVATMLARPLSDQLVKTVLTAFSRVLMGSHRVLTAVLVARPPFRRYSRSTLRVLYGYSRSTLRVLLGCGCPRLCRPDLPDSQGTLRVLFGYSSVAVRPCATLSTRSSLGRTRR